MPVTGLEPRSPPPGGVGIRTVLGIPTPFPTVGTPSHTASTFVFSPSLAVRPAALTPDIGRFYASHGCFHIEMEAVLAKNLPRRSRSSTGSHTDGLGIEDRRR